MAEKMKLDDILAGIRQEKDEEEKRKKKRKEEAYRWFDESPWYLSSIFLIWSTDSK
ncbi:MAG: hypothetical protein IKI75_11260 [Lachnospiraceae bacterium]|nr:hypothetical protein [Lachnospiraceae bacterium]